MLKWYIQTQQDDMHTYRGGTLWLGAQDVDQRDLLQGEFFPVMIRYTHFAPESVRTTQTKRETTDRQTEKSEFRQKFRRDIEREITHTHTHTHVYIYMYIYIRTNTHP
jgi:hypothetical protein